MTRLERLRNRRLDPLIHSAQLRYEVYDRLQDDESICYAIGSMQPIDPDYTAAFFAESLLIQNVIQPAVGIAGIPTEVRFQGSLTNDTHVEVSCDMEILVIDTNFTTLEPPQKAVIPYEENPVEDLRALRELSIKAVESGFPEIKMDTSEALSVLLSGGGLRREIRLLFANWYNTNEYATRQDESFRGLNMLDIHQAKRVFKSPFIHNALIEEKDQRSKGSIRKLIRLLKSLLVDAEEKNGLSGYDLSSLIWNMPERNLSYGPGRELQLINSAYDYLIYVLTNERYRNNLKVPDGTRAIFPPDGATKNQLLVTSNLLGGLWKDILRTLQRTSRNLADVLIDY
jgi:hypothetical protein